MRNALLQYGLWEWTCKWINVTAPPVSLSGPVAQRMRILLHSVSSAIKELWTLTFPSLHRTCQKQANILLMIWFKPMPSRHDKIWDLCKIQPFKLYRVSILIFLPQIIFFIFCLLFVQACFSSMETGWLCNRNRVQRRKDLSSVLVVRVVEGWGVGGRDWAEVLSFQFLPRDHRAGLWLARGGGGSAELREATVARFQAGHRTPESRDKSREHVSKHTQTLKHFNN